VVVLVLLRPSEHFGEYGVTSIQRCARWILARPSASPKPFDRVPRDWHGPPGDVSEGGRVEGVELWGHGGGGVPSLTPCNSGGASARRGIVKTCSRCRETKQLVDFHRRRASPDSRAPACKACTAVYAKERYWRDAEKRRADSKRYRDANPERRRQWQRAYNARHREELAARFAAMGWRKRWAALHPDKRRAIEAKRRARKRLTAVGAVDYETIYERDGGVCYLCREPVVEAEREFDHIQPLSRGGSHTEDNIALAHAMCNRRKGVSSAESFPAALIPRSAVS